MGDAARDDLLWKNVVLGPGSGEESAKTFSKMFLFKRPNLHAAVRNGWICWSN